VGSTVDIMHPPPSCAKVKNEWSYTSAPSYLPSWSGQSQQRVT